MKKAFILVLTNFFILTLILLGKPVKAQTTEITGQFLYGLELYVLPERETNPDYTHAIYSATITDTDFITSGLYKNWLEPYLPSGMNGYVYIVDSSHTISNVRLGGGYLEQGQVLSFSYEPYIDMKHYNLNYSIIDRFRLNPVNNILFESSGGNLEYISYYESNDGTIPRIKLIDATTNINDYNRVKEAINGYDVGYQNGYNIGYQNGLNSGYDNGFNDGQNNGYNAGYNEGEYNGYYEGYDIGYERGVQDASSPGYVEIQYYNQLVQLTNSQQTINDVVFSTYEDGKISLSGTATSDTTFTFAYIDVIALHIYYMWGCPDNSTYDNYYIIDNWNGQTATSDGFRGRFSSTNRNVGLRILVKNNILTNGAIFYPQVVDLTLMYGEGNEPDLEQCKNIFRAQYYPYSTGEVLNINYLDGFNDGKSIGYDEGVSYQATQQLTSDGWIKNIFTGIGSFLAIEIIPNVTIGLIVGIPFIISVAWFVIKMARGGGNN